MGTSKKFENSFSTISGVPGVGQYNLQNKTRGPSAPKYTMRPRSYYNENKGACSPGPGNYNPNFNVEHKTNEKYTMRPKTALLQPNERVPGPGQYSLRNDNADLIKPSYRFGHEIKGKADNSSSLINPGPGNYSVNDKPVVVQAPKFSFGKEDRSGNQSAVPGGRDRAKTPGPGQYLNQTVFGSGGPKISMSFNRPSTSMNRGISPGPGQYSNNMSNFVKAPQYK